MSSVHDFTLLPTKLKDNIILLAGIGLKQCFELMETVSVGTRRVIDIWNIAFPRKSQILRKLSAIRDKEGKTRIVGVFDY